MPDTDHSPQQAASTVATWLADLQAALDAGDADRLANLLGEGVLWRDVLSFEWDLATWSGRAETSVEIARRAATAHVVELRPDDEVPATFDLAGNEPLIFAYFRYGAATTLGRGVVRLGQDSDGVWRARTVLTQVDELVGHPEHTGANRPWGVADGPVAGRVPWHEQHRAQATYADREPAVVIVGAGQAGLSLAARLKQLDVDVLLVERNERVGDNWRLRYPTLNLHDPIWVNSLPYIEYPVTWPIFTPRDKFADWLESYVSSLDLNVWTSTPVGVSTFDEASGRWDVPVTRPDGSTRELHPKHLVLAVGLHGAPLQPQYPGQQDFVGDIVHSSTFDGTADLTGKKALVVGAGTSAHDVVQAAWEQGAEVTMVRRSPSIVITRPTFMVTFAGRGPDPDPVHRELTYGSVPWPMALQNQKKRVDQWERDDAQTLERLAAAGYAAHYGAERTGTLAGWLKGGKGGFYIDVGALDLLMDGRVAVRQGVQIAELRDKSAVLSDGTELEADLIINATGYGDIREHARRFIGDRVDEIPDIHHLDAHGELSAIWRPTGVENFWFMVGNIQMSRYFSKVLALQIAAREHGLLD